MSVGKRAAGRELNHDNWNDEDDGEECGDFKKATDDEIQRRVRKVAKRRNVDSENSPAANPFSGFGGFNFGHATSTPASTPSPFSFLAKIPSIETAPKTNGTSEKSSSTPQIEYLSKVKALNIAVADWIKTHVDDNPLCILTPVFKDYEKYLKEFDELKKKSKENEIKPKDPEPKPPASSGNFSFGKPSVPYSSPISSNSGSSNSFRIGGTASPTLATSPPKTPAENKGITFGIETKGITFGSEKGITFGSENKGITFGSSSSTLNSQPSAVSSTFSFGLPNTSTTSNPSIFGGLSSTSTFSFGNTVAPPPANSTAEQEDGDEQPPKNDFVPVVEDDSLYSKRCKVFVKGASDFNDRGVGTLFIKKAEGNKIQMIVRADTNLGNILLNIMIVDGLPVSRLGKNNVMVVCIPTPDAKPPPTSVLLRVKTGDEANELLATINKYKN